MHEQGKETAAYGKRKDCHGRRPSESFGAVDANTRKTRPEKLRTAPITSNPPDPLAGFRHSSGSGVPFPCGIFSPIAAAVRPTGTLTGRSISRQPIAHETAKRRAHGDSRGGSSRHEAVTMPMRSCGTNFDTMA